MAREMPELVEDGGADGAVPALAVAIARFLEIRGLSRRQFVERIAPESARWAVYRLLAGKTHDPRLTTFLAVANALEVSPTELAQAARLIPFVARAQSLDDVRLRRTFRTIQALDPELKALAISAMDNLAQSFADHRKRLAGRRSTT